MSVTAKKPLNQSRITEPDKAPGLHARVVSFLEGLATQQKTIADKLRRDAKEFDKIKFGEGAKDRIDGAEYAELLEIAYRHAAEVVVELTPKTPVPAAKKE